MHPLSVFLERLRAQGFVITLRDYERISRVLAADGAWTVLRLQRVLGQLLTHSCEETQRFEHEFQSFFSTDEDVLYPIDLVQWRQEIKTLLALPSATPATPANEWVIENHLSIELTKHTTTKPFWHYGQIVLMVLLLALVGGSQLKNMTASPSESATQSPVTQPIESPTTTTTTTTEQITPTPNTQTTTIDQRILPNSWRLLILLALLTTGSIMGWWWTAFRPLKVRQTAHFDPALPAHYFDDASVGGTMPAWLEDSTADFIADQIRYRLTTDDSTELDLEASIKATAGAGAIPVLEFYKCRVLQNVLILTDQLHIHTHWHSLAFELAHALDVRGIAVTLGYFSTSLERFRTQQGLLQHLEDWVEENEQGILVIIADTHQCQALSRFAWRDYPQARLLTRQDSKQWDVREYALQELGAALFIADQVGLQAAWSADVAHTDSLRAGLNTAIGGQYPQESDEAFLQRYLGVALPWAQALAHYPGAWSLSAAEQLRGVLFAEIPRLVLQRLLDVPETYVAAGVAQFSPHWQRLLRAGFLRQPLEVQRAVIEQWLALMQAVEPVDQQSLAWAVWRWKVIRLGWWQDADHAAQALHELVQALPALGDSIREELQHLPEDEGSIELLQPRSRVGQRHLLELGEWCGLRRAKVYALASTLIRAALVSTGCLVGLIGVGIWNDFHPPRVEVVAIPDTPQPLAEPSQTQTIAVEKVEFQVQQQMIRFEMVSIPSGTFTMGCVVGRDDVEGGCYDDEKPSHEVNVKAFQLAKTEVTVAQYQACVDDGGCPAPEWDAKDVPSYYTDMGSALTDKNYPIVGVSWDNAQSYVQWLSNKTGKPYRLPSEAEWEYAARAGSNTAYSWGNSIGKNKANCDSSCGDSYKYTAPVGSFTANSYGLHDMHGNVYEWVASCSASYASAPSDSTVVASTDCSQRVLRGGSWFNFPQILRSALRNHSEPTFRSSLVGFRVAAG